MDRQGRQQNSRFPWPRVDIRENNRSGPRIMTVFYDLRKFKLCYLSWRYESTFGQCVDGCFLCLLSGLFPIFRLFLQSVKTQEEKRRKKFTNWKSTRNGNGLTTNQTIRAATMMKKTEKPVLMDRPHVNINSQHTWEAMVTKKYQLASYIYFYHTVIEKLEQIS